MLWGISQCLELHDTGEHKEALTQDDADDKLFNSAYTPKEKKQKPSLSKLGKFIYTFFKRERKMLEIVIIMLK